MVAATNQLMEVAVDDIEKAYLLALRSKESEAWLRALPSHPWVYGSKMISLGLIAVRHFLGAPLCSSHQCQHCGKEVDAMGRRMGLAVDGASGDITDTL